MAKVKLTKNELRKQKDSLKLFMRFLPTLELKKKQLQAEIARVRQAYEALSEKERDLRDAVTEWVAVFGEDAGIAGLVGLERVETASGNIAGVEIPVFVKAHFVRRSYDLFAVPLWVDRAVAVMQELLSLKAQREVLGVQAERLGDELLTTTQRVNLFEKVKIPEAQDNIRKIQVALGDLQTAAVVRGKIAKAKIIAAELM